jgi:SnoaL-like domain
MAKTKSDSRRSRTGKESSSKKEMKAKHQIEVLRKRIVTLEGRLRVLEDIEEIKKLQRIYGYYLDNKLWDEVVDLFSDHTESISIGNRGLYLEKKGVDTFFKKVFGGGKSGRQPRELHNHMQLQGVVNVDPGGKTAKGRWRALIQMTYQFPDGMQAGWGEGVYENEYVKENGKWKFKKMLWHRTFATPYQDGWAKTATGGMGPDAEFPPDGLLADDGPYPSNYVVPYHYKHPITGK